jgi:hypothetical protein
MSGSYPLPTEPEGVIPSRLEFLGGIADSSTDGNTPASARHARSSEIFLRTMEQTEIESVSAHLRRLTRRNVNG